MYAGGAFRLLEYQSSLDRGESANSVLCFEVPEDEEGLRVFYESIAPYIGWRRILGFWEVSADVAPPAPAEARSTSDTYGTRTNPVPLGESGLGSSGIAITVVSADLNANQALEDAHGEYYRPPTQGNRYVTVRARVQDVTGRDGDQFDVRQWTYGHDFGLIASSGLITFAASHDDCGIGHERLRELNVFKGGWMETDLCFEIPIEENRPVLFYTQAAGFWDISTSTTPPAPIEPATPISDTYGTLANPAPLGEKAVASNGVAITIMGSDHDLVSGRVVVRARVEGYGEENALYRVDYDDFGMVASSGMIVNSDGDQCGRHYYGMEVDVITSGWQEGDLCFNIPVGDTDPVVFYFGNRHRYFPEEVDRVLGFWAARRCVPAIHRKAAGHIGHVWHTCQSGSGGRERACVRRRRDNRHIVSDRRYSVGLSIFRYAYVHVCSRAHGELW